MKDYEQTLKIVKYINIYIVGILTGMIIEYLLLLNAIK